MWHLLWTKTLLIFQLLLQWYIIRILNGSSGSTYALLQMFLVMFSATRSPKFSLPIAVKLCHVIAIWMYFTVQVPKFGNLPENLEANKCNFLCALTKLQISTATCDSLQNESRYPKSERQVIKNDLSCLWLKSPMVYGI